MHSSALSRTSSAASISSDDAARRTRKRFSSVQLVMLEQLFHQTSHPTREQREAVAQAAAMEIKSVTIWFQNKRQTERKVALYHASSLPTDGSAHYNRMPFPSSSPSLLLSASSSPSAASHPARIAHAHTRTHSTSSQSHIPRRKITPPRPRPSLDRIATRSESRLPPPRTPTRPRDPRASLWDNMPSSPLAPPPASPPARDLIEFMGSHRTLEWACEAARIAGKAERRLTRERRLSGQDKEHTTEERDREGNETEEDDIEAVTPEGSLGTMDAARTRVRLPLPITFAPMPGSVPKGKWQSESDAPEGVGTKDGDALQDDDMMRAALALCGLGRRSG